MRRPGRGAELNGSSNSVERRAGAPRRCRADVAAEPRRFPRPALHVGHGPRHPGTARNNRRRRAGPCFWVTTTQPTRTRRLEAPPMRASQIVPLVVATALFMENTDATVIATALPHLARSLGEDPIALKLALTDRLPRQSGDLHPDQRLAAETDSGRERCSGSRSASSCGVAGLRRLELARRLRRRPLHPGLGGAMMVPVGRLLILRSVPKSRTRQRAGLPHDPRADRGRSWGRRSAASSRPISTGAGSSSSTSPIGIAGSCWRRSISRMCARRAPAPRLRRLSASGLGLATLMLGIASTGGISLPDGVSWGCLVAGIVPARLYLRHSRGSPTR